MIWPPAGHDRTRELFSRDAEPCEPPRREPEPPADAGDATSASASGEGEGEDGAETEPELYDAAAAERERDRPADCDCGPAFDRDGPPCWPCYRDGFESPNPLAPEEAGADDVDEDD